MAGLDPALRRFWGKMDVRIKSGMTLGKDPISGVKALMHGCDVGMPR
jgi:hypothetical protein